MKNGVWGVFNGTGFHSDIWDNVGRVRIVNSWISWEWSNLVLYLDWWATELYMK